MAPTLYDLKEMMAHEVESATTGPVKDDPAHVARLRSEWIEHLKRAVDGGAVQLAPNSLPPDGYAAPSAWAIPTPSMTAYAPLADRDPGPQAIPSGVKYDQDKAPVFRLALVTDALEQVARVLEFGAQKYPAADNWKSLPNLEPRYFSSALRHTLRDAQGEHPDTETGLPHLAHAICCLLFILQSRAEGGPRGPLSK